MEDVKKIVSGMDRDSYAVDKNQYTHALNANVETSDGNKYLIGSEPSNHLSTKIKDGFKVIGHERDFSTNDLYLILTNPESGDGEIGKISLSPFVDIEVLDEIFCDSCPSGYDLGDRLEDLNQEGYLQYETLISDECHTDVNKKFGFSIHYPIKNVVLKREGTRLNMYIADGLNYSKVIELSNLSKYYTITVPCGEDETIQCPDLEMMRQFKEAESPTIVSAGVEIGGNLPEGLYQYFVKYCDKNGNDITEVLAYTTDVKLFDRGAQVRKDISPLATSLAIKLELGNLDTRYSHYKIIVRQSEPSTTSTGGVVHRSYELGVYGTNQTTVIHDNTDRLKEVGDEAIYIGRRYVEVTDINSVLNGTLVHTGITETKTMNLQPVMNFLGQFLEWKTFRAKEDLYEKPIPNANNVGYQRDEVVPIGISFTTKSGYETPLFPLISRTAKELETEVVNLNNDRKSLEQSVSDCVGGTRDRYWQLYNTATVDHSMEDCNEDVGPTTIVEDFLEESCVMKDVYSVYDGVMLINTDNEYTNLRDYLDFVKEQGPENCYKYFEEASNDICRILYSNFDSVNCDEEDLFDGLDCGITKTGQEVNLGDVEGVVETPIERIFPFDYYPIIMPTVSAMFMRGLRKEDRERMQKEQRITLHNILLTYFGHRWGDYADNTTFLLREQSPQALTCEYANEAVYTPDIKQPERETQFNSCFLVPFVDTEDKIIDSGFTNKRTRSEGAGDIFRNYLNIMPVGWSWDMDPEEMDTLYETTLGYFTVIIGGEQFTSQNIEDEEEPLNVEDSILAWKEKNDGAVRALGIDIIYYKSTIVFTTSYSLVGAIAFMSDNFAGVFTEDTNLGDAEYVSRMANWFRIIPEGHEEEFIIDVSGQTDERQVVGHDILIDHYKRYLPEDDRLKFRVSLFKNCDSTQALYTAKISWDEALMIRITRQGSDIIITDNKKHKDLGTEIKVLGGYNREGYYLVYDTFTIDRNKAVNGPLGSWGGVPGEDGKYVPGFVTFPTLGSYSVTWRGKEFKQVKIDYDKLSFDKIQYFEGDCTFMQPVLNNCGVVPHESGEFAYWESTEVYPDNKYLYDSSSIKVRALNIPSNIKARFEEAFTEGVKVDGNYRLKDTTDFRCKPIRHFKMPDNDTAPIIPNTHRTSFSDSIIHVLGVTVDENIINYFLDLAQDNGLIDSKQRASITGYKLYRGNMSLERSVMASGLLYDTRDYRKGKDNILYPNYPYNTFGKDIFNNIDTEGLGREGSKFTFHSPETDYSNSTFGTEFSVQGVQYGTSRGKFQEVEEHPKWTILSDRAKKQAKKMADGEILAETLLEVAHITSRASTGFFAGMVGGAIVPWGAIAGGAMVAGANYLFNGKRDKYMMEWLRVYENLGTPTNFAYYYHSVGLYNYMDSRTVQGHKLRGIDVNKHIPSGLFNITNPRTADRVVMNNKHRESSVYLDMGMPIRYSGYNKYSNYDAGTNPSMFRLEKGNYYQNKGESVEVAKNIASMYGYLKNWKPSQHGKISDVDWVYTGYKGNLQEPTMCANVFGGDTYITRHTLKRKQAQFDLDYMKQADMTPVDYAFYNNIGENPEYYVRFKSNHKSMGRGDGEYEYDLGFDNEKVNGKYYTSPSKFYLYYYGIPSFLCESRINTNYRTAGPELRDNFYPQVGDVGRWTQQINVPIDEPNTFNFNSMYLGGGLTIPKSVLDDNYNPNDDKNNPYQGNMAIYSLPDRDEFGSSDPWLIYRPNNIHYFSSEWGKLRGLKGIENETILGIFDSRSVLFNAVDSSIDMGGDVIAKNYGDGQMFARRVKDFATTKTGFGGSQGFHNISTEYGHFHVDNKSGEIYQIAGNSMYDINRINSSGTPTKMFNWFKQNLPFKILNSGIQGIEDLDLDNAYNSIGMTLGYDSRHKRLLITKKDYKVIDRQVEYRKGEGFYLGDTKVELTDKRYFIDVSFSIGYALEGGYWMSFYSYVPDFYVSDKDFFYSGKNEEGRSNGIWIHGATNKSFQVFYQKFYPFELEYPLLSERGVGSQTLADVNFYIDARKYHSEYDYADIDAMWNEIVISGREVNSGKLIPIIANGSVGQLMEYPKTDPTYTKQEILATKIGEGRYSINYFYDRVDRKKRNTPLWIQDENGVGRSLNTDKVNFKAGRDVLNPIRGRVPTIKLTQNEESRIFFGMDLSLVSRGPVKP